jgi:hypothetical protein
MTAANDKNAAPAEYAFPRDDSHGFAGTLRLNYDLGWRANARLWLFACQTVEGAFGETDRRIVRNFLRSGSGRHLADDLSRRQPRDPEEADVQNAIAGTNWKKDWGTYFREVAELTRRGGWED